MVRVFTSHTSGGALAIWTRLRSRVVLGWVAACLVVPAWAASFTASLDRTTVVVGETVGLTLTFEGGSLSSNPRLPAIPGVQVAAGISQSMNSSIGPDGKMSSVQSFKFNLIPTQPGEITIPAFQVEVAGQRLSSQPLKLQVLREDPAAPPVSLANTAAFLWPVWPKQECYVNEVLTLELRLYLRSGVRFGEFQFPPLTADGLQASQLTQGGDFERAVGNVPFRVIPLWVALTPTRPGLLEIGPLQGSITMNPAEWPASIFRYGPQPKTIGLALDRQALRVLPLPTNNVPASFNGAVGHFELAVSAGPTNVTVGDPITVRIHVTGRGALDALTLPEQRAWKEFKTYSATSKVETKPPLGVEGSKLFEQVVAPQSADLAAIPPVEFSFFDPAQKSYRTLTSPPIALTVRAAATVAPVIAAGKPGTEDTAPPAQDIVGLKQRLGTLAAIGQPLPLRSWFWALQAIPVLVWLGAVVWRKRADALANNPRLRRRKQVAQAVNSGLTQLRKLADQNQSEAFFATLFHLLQEQIGERLDLPASAITEAVVDERLKAGGLAEAACATLHDLFQTCNLARYAPVQTSQELAAIVPRVEAVIEQLRRFEP